MSDDSLCSVSLHPRADYIQGLHSQRGHLIGRYLHCDAHKPAGDGTRDCMAELLTSLHLSYNAANQSFSSSVQDRPVPPPPCRGLDKLGIAYALRSHFLGKIPLSAAILDSVRQEIEGGFKWRIASRSEFPTSWSNAATGAPKMSKKTELIKRYPLGSSSTLYLISSFSRLTCRALHAITCSE